MKTVQLTEAQHALLLNLYAAASDTPVQGDVLRSMRENGNDPSDELWDELGDALKAD